MGVGIDEHEPVAGGRAGAGIARAGDLVDWLEHNLCAFAARDLRGVIGGVVVADDDFSGPTALVKCLGRDANTSQRGSEQFLFVECWNDDGDSHFAFTPTKRREVCIANTVEDGLRQARATEFSDVRAVEIRVRGAHAPRVQCFRALAEYLEYHDLFYGAYSSDALIRPARARDGTRGARVLPCYYGA